MEALHLFIIIGCSAPLFRRYISPRITDKKIALVVNISVWILVLSSFVYMIAEIVVFGGDSNSPNFGSRVNLSYEHTMSNETVILGEAVFTENGFVISSDRMNVTSDAFVFSDGWYLIHQLVDFTAVGVRAGWLLVQDTSEENTPDGVAEFRAQYKVPPNTNLDFSTSNEATFVLDIVDGFLITEENVICTWTISEE